MPKTFTELEVENASQRGVITVLKRKLELAENEGGPVWKDRVMVAIILAMGLAGGWVLKAWSLHGLKGGAL